MGDRYEAAHGQLGRVWWRWRLTRSGDQSRLLVSVLQKHGLVEAAAKREALAQSRHMVLVLREHGLVEAAGIEFCRCQNANILMACDFGCYKLKYRQLDDRRLSTPVLPSLPESTHVMETFWRRVGLRRYPGPSFEADWDVARALFQKNHSLCESSPPHVQAVKVDAGAHESARSISAVPRDLLESRVHRAIDERSHGAPSDIVYR
jgi:hypothetical protein